MGKLDSIIDSSGSDIPFISEVIALYKSTSIEALDMAFKAIDSNDRLSLKKAAHKIKGSALNFGINAVSDLAKHIETNSQTLASADLSNCLVELQKSNSLLITELEQELSLLQKK